jgi:hypothetical protein
MSGYFLESILTALSPLFATCYQQSLSHVGGWLNGIRYTTSEPTASDKILVQNIEEIYTKRFTKNSRDLKSSNDRNMTQ